MARINTNVPAVVAQRSLVQNQRALATSLERLSSGLRINRGADDPAGLINSESIRADIAGADKAISNSQRAANVIATTEGSLNETASLLIDIQGLIVEMANTGALSSEEIEANQLQIDLAIQSINRIANTASFAGRKLLDGSLDYSVSGVNSNAITTLQVFGASFGTRPFVPVDVVLTTSAQKGVLQFRGSATTSPVTIEIAGNDGVTTVHLVSGQPINKVLASVNASSQATGVEAYYLNSANPNSGIGFRSVEYGSDQFVSIQALPGSGSFVVVDENGNQRQRDEGQDAVATINGVASVGRGLNVVVNNGGMDLSLRLNENFGLTSTTFAITGGGALFQLGPDVNVNQQISIGVQSVAPSRLGNAFVGFLSQLGRGEAYEPARDPTTAGIASDIVNEAIRQVAVLRGRLGAFERNTLQTNINSLRITVENLTSSESAIRDTDFAYETSRLTRAQILVNAGTSVLAIANTTPQSVLSLLGR